jgi:hypothetical protein
MSVTTTWWLASWPWKIPAMNGPPSGSSSRPPAAAAARGAQRLRCTAAMDQADLRCTH